MPPSLPGCRVAPIRPLWRPGPKCDPVAFLAARRYRSPVSRAERDVLRNRLAPIMLGLSVAVLGVGCGGGESGDQPAQHRGKVERLQVVTTVAPITSIVANVAGDLAAITGVVPEGTNSHTYEPEP